VDIQYLMKQAKKLEKAVSDAKEQLGGLSVDAESGGGLVKIVMNGKCEVTRVEIDPKALSPFGAAERREDGQHAIDPADKAMLEDLVAAAVNAAVEKARAAADAHLSKATGGIKIPGVG
jgi:DNA-binding protein YbaB